MAKKQSFADKSAKKSHTATCPACNEVKQFIKHVKAVKSTTGSWKFRTQSVGVCKCNEADIYN